MSISENAVPAFAMTTRLIVAMALVAVAALAETIGFDLYYDPCFDL